MIRAGITVSPYPVKLNHELGELSCVTFRPATKHNRDIQMLK
jgi:hypothetical protein